jgi:hypothetical protein
MENGAVSGVACMFGRVGVLLCGLLAGGCAAVDTVHPRYETINHSTERARNESILLNIVRASQDAPLNFVAFSSVSGTSTLSANAALPTFLVGPFAPLTVPTGNIVTAAGVSQSTIQPPAPQRAVQFNNSTLGGGGVATTQFSIATFETRDFYNALLRPVDLPTLNYFIRQGYSRELLFWLFADSVEEIVNGQSYGYKYVPGKPEKACNTVLGRRKCVADMIEIAVASGLTVETKAIDKPTGQEKKTAPGVYARFCFDTLLRNRNELGDTEEGRLELARLRRLMWSPAHLPRCRSHWVPAATEPGSDETATDTLEFEQPGTSVGTVRYRIVTRSTFGIYQFLGGLMANGEAEGLMLTEGKDSSLLTVVQGSGDGCFQDAQYNGQMYCIPDRAKNTKRIVQLLAQLVALQTSTQDLAVTPLVRVQQ